MASRSVRRRYRCWSWIAEPNWRGGHRTVRSAAASVDWAQDVGRDPALETWSTFAQKLTVTVSEQVLVPASQTWNVCELPPPFPMSSVYAPSLAVVVT
jgi:hypothetical protein